MKKNISIFIFFLIGAFIFAQAPVDLFDPFYEDLAIWKNTGLINDSPEVMPYPLQEIERILDIVIEKGTPNQVRRAKEYKARFFNKIFHFGGRTGFDIGGKPLKKQFYLSPLLEMNFGISRILTGSAHFNISLLKMLPNDEPHPVFQFSNKDIAKDMGNVGKYHILPELNSSVTIGTPEYYFSAGMARTSFGPFAEDNILIGQQAFHSGRFVFVVNKEKFTYNQVLLAVSATNDKGEYESRVPKKFLAMHSINYRPLPWISIGILDSVIYGDRFEPLYLLPLTAFFLGQSIYRFPDNSLLGLTFTIKPIDGLKMDMVLLADDLGFNEIIKFKEAKWRMAGQFGISYAMPKDHWFTMADLNYTMVMPYCYTHYQDFNVNTSNYQNYTHNAQPLGSNLPPNSDRIKLKLKFRPLYGMDINFSNIFIRHANISESIEDVEILRAYFAKEYTTDGSAFNYAAVGGGAHAFLYSTPFLKQKTIQYINQLGLEIVAHFPILKSGGNMQFKLGYVFEANINSGVNRNMFGKTDTTPSTQEEIIAEKNKQLSEWRKKAIDKNFNHYLTISAKVIY